MSKMWNHRELPPDFYRQEIARLQEENAKLRADAEVKLGFWSRHVFWKWLLGLIVSVLLMLLAARAGGPRGVEVAAIVGLFVLGLTFAFRYLSKNMNFD